jgi:hypothetical protein
MFVAISVSLGIGARDYVFAIRRYDEEGVRKVRCRLRGQLPRIVRSRPTFLLDGTASLDLLKVVFRDIPFHVREVPVRLGARGVGAAGAGEQDLIARPDLRGPEPDLLPADRGAARELPALAGLG